MIDRDSWIDQWMIGSSDDDEDDNDNNNDNGDEDDSEDDDGCRSNRACTMAQTEDHKLRNQITITPNYTQG